MRKTLIVFALTFLLPAGSLFSQGYLAFGYGPSFPLGATKDYIGETSWRNINLEAGYFVTPYLSVGASFSWYGAFRDYPYQTWSNIGSTNVTVTGQQWRYGNVYPLAAVAKCWLPFRKATFRPFVGMGVGPCFVNRRLDFGVWSWSDYFSQFCFYPELGGSFWFRGGFAITLDGRYNYSVKTSEWPSQSNVALNLGLVWKIGESVIAGSGKAPR